MKNSNIEGRISNGCALAFAIPAMVVGAMISHCNHEPYDKIDIKEKGFEQIEDREKSIDKGYKCF